MTVTTARDVRVHDGASESVRRAHELFVETIGPEGVENLDSFRLTVSHLTTPTVDPKLIEVYDGDQLIGAMLGVYLHSVNGGMVLYAGVRMPCRGQGLYMELRTALLGGLDEQSSTGLGFVVSEVDGGSWLQRKYLDDWGAFIAPLDYVQPAVQGLPRRSLDLMVMPQATDMAEIIQSLPTIVREVFTGVYRIPEPESHPDFLHIINSLGKT